MVPTRELAEQVLSNIKQFCMYCSKDVTALNLATDLSPGQQKPLLAELPQVIISTPSRIVAHLESGNITLDATFQSLVIDEADLMLSFGYESDLKKLIKFLPKVYQAYLMSATLSEEVNDMKKQLLRNPVTIRLEEGTDEPSRLSQFCVKTDQKDKFLILFFILKFRLLKGKCLIFVNDIDRCYRLKLFLNQFSIQAGVLNSELPHASRLHTVQEFNKGVFDYLIATDESELKGEVDSDDEKSLKPSKTGGKKQKKIRQDKEYGISRGIDFKNVAAVINFDVPTSTRTYTHRIGRTARGDASGMALSFVSESDTRLWNKIEYKQKSKNMSIEPYQFDMSQIDGFRYRCDDALRSVTKTTIREARLKELKAELLNSEKLKSHFAENPKDLDAIRHDRPLHVMRSQPHLKHIPNYLAPNAAAASTEDLGDLKVTFHKKKQNRRRPQRDDRKRKMDPLKSLVYASKKKKIE